jgi:hypothetical protein
MFKTARMAIEVERYRNDSEDTFEAKQEILAIPSHPEPTIPQAKNRICGSGDGASHYRDCGSQALKA